MKTLRKSKKPSSHLGLRITVETCKKPPKDREEKPARWFLWEVRAFQSGHVY